MAERRMFARSIVLSDAFLDMPPSARCLYFSLAMLADDDGFVNSPRSIMRQTGATLEDMKRLLAERYILDFDSGVVVIRHWRVHNLIRKDRYRETIHLKEKAKLIQKGQNAYIRLGSNPDTDGNPSGSNPDTKGNPSGSNPDTNGKPPGYHLGAQDRLGKVRSDKDREGEEIRGLAPPRARRFEPPSVEAVESYCRERGSAMDARRFVDYYTSNGWMVGKAKMKDWKAAARNWERRDRSERQSRPREGNPFLAMLEEDGHEQTGDH